MPPPDISVVIKNMDVEPHHAEHAKQERRTFFWKGVAICLALALALAIYSFFVNGVL
jgi:hypothetical protein